MDGVDVHALAGRRFGAPFDPYTAALPSDRTTTTDRGVLYTGAPEPTGADGLEPLDRWLPPELFSTEGPKPDHGPVLLIRALTIPAALQQLSSR